MMMLDREIHVGLIESISAKRRAVSEGIPRTVQLSRSNRKVLGEFLPVATGILALPAFEKATGITSAALRTANASRVDVRQVVADEVTDVRDRHANIIWLFFVRPSGPLQEVSGIVL
jgi:hypothetical protein